MKIKILKAKEKDFPYIQEKIKNYLLDHSDIHWAQFFVAKIKAATLAFGRVIDHGNFFEIASLGVDYYHRKKGIGQEILSFLVQEAKRLDPRKPIYGITHIEEFLGNCGFACVEDNYPDYLDYKRKHLCRLDESMIKIMKWQGPSA